MTDPIKETDKLKQVRDAREDLRTFETQSQHVNSAWFMARNQSTIDFALTYLEAALQEDWNYNMEEAPRDTKTEILGYWRDDTEINGEKLINPHCYEVLCWQAKNYPPTEYGWFPPDCGGEEGFERFPTAWREITPPSEALLEKFRKGEV